MILLSTCVYWKLYIICSFWAQQQVQTRDPWSEELVVHVYHMVVIRVATWLWSQWLHMTACDQSGYMIVITVIRVATWLWSEWLHDCDQSGYMIVIRVATWLCSNQMLLFPLRLWWYYNMQPKPILICSSIAFSNELWATVNMHNHHCYDYTCSYVLYHQTMQGLSVW